LSIDRIGRRYNARHRRSTDGANYLTRIGDGPARDRYGGTMLGLRKRLRYRFDNWMARGIGAQILLLALVTTVLVLVTALAIVVFDVVPTSDKGVPDSFGMVVWKALMRALDAGTLAGDVAGWTFLFVMLFVTLGGIFVLSALIGIINQGFGAMIDRLRRGHSAALETGHTVILGWGPKIFTLLRELGEANANQRHACVVILADRDKVEMDATIASELGKHRMRIVTRRGSTMSPDDLHLVSLATAKSIVVLAPEHHANGDAMAAHESDTVVLKTLLALVKAAPADQLHIVAELFDEQSESVARMVVGDAAALILAAPLISRLLVQTGRQPGLSIVYTELLDFAGVEIYIQPQPALVGKTFREAVFAYDSSTLLGVVTAADDLVLAPPADRRLVDGDRLIAISEDDDTLVLDGASLAAGALAVPTAIDEAAIIDPPQRTASRPERTLVLGASRRLGRVLTELDSYVAPGSTVLVVGELEPPAEALGQLRNMQAATRVGDVTQRATLDALDVTSFDHILLLSETVNRTQEMADARTTVTLLHLRDLERRAGKKVPITSEILDIQSRELATVAEADDFIVSNTLVSLMVAQVAENPHLVQVFDELFSAGGKELYLKPVTDYVRAGELSFGVVCEAALRRGEIAIGYRIGSHARDPEVAFGIVVNPSKRAKVRLGSGDSVIVIAED
jgi:voltage-gated potassium channel Kch